MPCIFLFACLMGGGGVWVTVSTFGSTCGVFWRRPFKVSTGCLIAVDEERCSNVCSSAGLWLVLSHFI